MATTTDTALRRKMIADMLAQGSSGAPIQHWSQGLNRLAQGFFGGLNMGALNAEEKAKEASAAAALASAPGLGTPPGLEPDPVVSALSPQPQAPTQASVMPLQRMAALQPSVPADVTTLEPQQTRGVIKGNLSDEPVVSMTVDGRPMPQPSPVAQALQPPVQMAQAQQSIPQQRTQMEIPPQMRDYIKRLLANKQTQAQGWALYNQYAKPTDAERPGQKKTDDIREYEYAVANGYKGSPVQFMQDMKKAGAQSISVNSTVNPFLKGIGEEVLKDREIAKAAATKAIPDIHEARKSLDAGAITGAGADIRLMAAKVGALFGMDTSTVANTEQLRAMISSSALENIKKLGANPSNVDLKFIKDVVGSNIALDEKTLRRLLDIQEKYARQAIRNYNTTAKKMMDADPETFGKMAPAMQFDEPPEYQRQPTQQEIQQEIQRRQLLRQQ